MNNPMWISMEEEVIYIFYSYIFGLSFASLETLQSKKWTIWCGYVWWENLSIFSTILYFAYILFSLTELIRHVKWEVKYGCVWQRCHIYIYIYYSYVLGLYIFFNVLVIHFLWIQEVIGNHSTIHSWIRVTHGLEYWSGL